MMWKDVLIDGFCFFAGMVCMMLIETCIDLRHSDYDRGYLGGCHDTAELLGEKDDET